MVDLDAVIRRARSATVRRDAAEAYVRELERSTSQKDSHDAPRDLGWSHASDAFRWPRWLVPTLAIAAGVVIALSVGIILAPRSAPTPLAALRVGGRARLV